MSGVKKVYDELKQLKYASVFDQHLAFTNFNLQLTNAKMLKQEYNDATIFTYVLTYKLSDNSFVHLKHRVVTYQPDGLTYFVYGKVLTSVGSELDVIPEPADSLFSFVNSDYLFFKFLRFDTDVFLNLGIKNQVLSVIQNYVLNHLTNLGLSCSAEQIINTASITIFVSSEKYDRLYDFLASLDWYSLLLPFKHLFSKLILKTTSTEKVFDFNHVLPNPTDLQLTFRYYGEASNNITIEINFQADDYFKNIYESENTYDEIDGWSLMPQLKPFYTQRRFTSNPIYNFVIFGKVPQITIHEKYLPIWRASVLKLFGFKINGTEYWFKRPLYVNRFFRPRFAESTNWNSYLSNHVTFI